MVLRKRRKFFVDPEFQGALLKRCLVHWGLCVLTGALLLVCWRVVSSPGEPSYVYFQELWTTYWRALVVTVVLLLVVLIDFARLSNRVCGPLMRLKSGLRQLAEGQAIEPLRFREGDFWNDFALAFNAAAERLGSKPTPGADEDTAPLYDHEGGPPVSVASRDG